ncbi:MAG: CbiX/SirB N-terminal domain-containing protein [Betaproteobacteria bacterium]
MERSPPVAPATARCIRKGILLIAHGSRDAGWAAPFEQLHERVGAHGQLVALAYLERMAPDIETAVRDLVVLECTHAVVVPLFLGQGGHVREDLPRIIAAEMQRHPSITLTLAPPIGEDSRVLDAITAACVAHLAGV